MNKITGIIAAVNYDDLLDITLSENKKSLDQIIIITNTTDEKTKKLCEKHDVICMQTDIFYINDSKFNRGMAYNLVFDSIKENLGWTLLMDADIVLPNNFSEEFFKVNPDKEYFYGCRRYGVDTYKEWMEVKNNPENLKKHTLFRGIGYGYFQLFNFKSEIIQNFIKNNDKYIYPPYPTVAEGDWVFRNRWSDWIFDPQLNDAPNQHDIINNDRAENPGKLKELSFKVIHLGQTGRNESSRITPKFN
jgi:hypothetical protein